MLFLLFSKRRHLLSTSCSVCVCLGKIVRYHGYPGLRPIIMTTIVVTNVKQYDFFFICYLLKTVLEAYRTHM